jgi:hypothetical protein
MASDPSSIYLSIQELCEYDNDVGLSESLLGMLNTIIRKNPTAARSAIVNGNEDWTLLHHAAFNQSLEFCKVLVEMDSGLVTVKATDRYGSLPFHCACEFHNFVTAKYLYGLFPESINIPGQFGRYPLHCVFWGFLSFITFIRRN